MTVLQAARYFYNAGFRGTGLIIITAIAGAESGYNPNATNTAGNTNGIDVGLAQINTYWHPQYNYNKLFDPQYNANAAFAISNKGTNFTPWVTYKQDLHLKYLAAAKQAAARFGNSGWQAIVVVAITCYILYKLIK